LIPQLCLAVGVPHSHNSCAVHIDSYEKAHNIPDGLLHAISKVESGRKDVTGRIVAWPWTVNAEGQGFYFATKAEAIAAVLKMKLKGIKSIDVGCMQVNLYHHPKAFKTLADAFDPLTNVAYAAKFLTGLKNELSTWHKAVAHYHSANPIHHVPYRKSVLNVWNRDLKSGGISLAAGVFESFHSSMENAAVEPSINRIRRLTDSRRIKSERNLLISAGSKAMVRRVTRGDTSHIRRVKL